MAEVDEKTDLDLYLDKTGQTFQYIMEGARAYGLPFIVGELIPQALKEEKKIVWKDDDSELGLVSYTLEDL